MSSREYAEPSKAMKLNWRAHPNKFSCRLSGSEYQYSYCEAGGGCRATRAKLPPAAKPLTFCTQRTRCVHAHIAQTPTPW